MALTVLKKTPTHCVVKVSGGGASETIALATTLLFGSREVAASPIVNIMGLHWSVAGSTGATIVRNSVTLWTLVSAWGEVFNGWSDTQQNVSDIVVTIPNEGGSVVLELLKVGGYGNTQHINPQDGI